MSEVSQEVFGQGLDLTLTCRRSGRFGCPRPPVVFGSTLWRMRPVRERSLTLLQEG